MNAVFPIMSNKILQIFVECSRVSSLLFKHIWYQHLHKNVLSRFFDSPQGEPSAYYIEPKHSSLSKIDFNYSWLHSSWANVNLDTHMTWIGAFSLQAYSIIPRLIHKAMYVSVKPILLSYQPWLSRIIRWLFVTHSQHANPKSLFLKYKNLYIPIITLS
mgnify:CR=1 FL=1